MPNDVTHLLFAEKVRKMLPDVRREAIDRYPDAYRLGSLGFDFLYVLRQLGMRGGRLGNRLHRECVREVFETFAAANGKNADRIFTYGAGLATHYALDRRAHPLVYFLSEQTLPRFYPAVYQNNLHNLAETEADSFAILNARLAPGGFDAAKYGKATRTTRREIAAFYETRVFPLLGEGVSRRAVSFCFVCWNALSGFRRDPGGRKKRWMLRLEKRKESRTFSSLFLPAERTDGADLLNLAKRAYPASRGCAARSDLSFPELYEAAAEDALRYLDAYFRADVNPDALRSVDFSVDYEGIAGV